MNVIHHPRSFRYVPVLRYRQQEISSLKSLHPHLSLKTLPLIEIVKEKFNSRSKGTFESEYTKSLKEFSHPFMIDFPMYLSLTTRTQREVASFLRPIQSSPPQRLAKFRELKSLKNMIPVVSYNPRTAYTADTIVREAENLRTIFSRLAFRLFIQGATLAISDITKVAVPGDIIIFDLDDAHHRNPALRPIYNSIANLGTNHGCSTVIVRTAIDQSITNVGLDNGQIVPQADNSLLSDYNSYGFHAFGDYAGVKKDPLQEGGTISPGFIYYSWSDNCYIGYNGLTRSLSEFEDHIAPSVVNSIYWRNYTNNHHATCPGCSIIQSIISGNESGKHQGKWKGISISHYIYTMEEFL